jgi:hypothetical protein
MRTRKQLSRHFHRESNASIAMLAGTVSNHGFRFTILTLRPSKIMSRKNHTLLLRDAAQRAAAVISSRSVF